MFSMPATIPIPDVVGVRLTDLSKPALLAPIWPWPSPTGCGKVGATGEFVEFFGPGVATLPIGERAVVANVAPEYGATGYFPHRQQPSGHNLQGPRENDTVFILESAESAIHEGPSSEPIQRRIMTVLPTSPAYFSPL